MMTFNERERECQRVFDENGPFWHLYTDGTVMQNIFCSDEEMKKGMMAWNYLQGLSNASRVSSGLLDVLWIGNLFNRTQ